MPDTLKNDLDASLLLDAATQALLDVLYAREGWGQAPALKMLRPNAQTFYRQMVESALNLSVPERRRPAENRAYMAVERVAEELDHGHSFDVSESEYLDRVTSAACGAFQDALMGMYPSDVAVPASKPANVQLQDGWTLIKETDRTGAPVHDMSVCPTCMESTIVPEPVFGHTVDVLRDYQPIEGERCYWIVLSLPHQ